ncbi:MAG: M1 family aminopeptidase [Candidatus Bipolaricaulis sp.]|nr:M1 family aminopeptidase [Candidatus Bipolaricaulis sp.]
MTDLALFRRVAPLLLLFFAPLALPCSAAADPTSYTLALDVNYGSGEFEGTMTVVHANCTPNALWELFFRLYPNSSTLYSGASIEVLDAHVGAKPVETSLFVDDTVLMLPLPQPLEPGQTVSVALSFRGRASQRLTVPSPVTHEYGILTKTPNVLTLTSFYPLLTPYLDEGWALDPIVGIGDALFAEASSYDVSLRVDARPTPIATGVLTDATRESDRVVYRYAADHARDFSIVLVDDGRVPRRVEVAGIGIRVWFRPDRGPAATRALERAGAAVTLFSDLIGPLPYDEIDVVEVPLQHIGGVELTGLVLLSETYTADPYDPFFDILVSHEVAHEWFYAAVGNDPVESPWLDEGVVTYLSNVFLAEAVSRDVAAAERQRWERSVSLSQSVHPELTLTAPLYRFPDSTTYSAFAYSGAAAEFAALRDRLGDGAFFAALAAYYQDSLFTIASPSDLREAFENACGCTMDGALFADPGSP